MGKFVPPYNLPSEYAYAYICVCVPVYNYRPKLTHLRVFMASRRSYIIVVVADEVEQSAWCMDDAQRSWSSWDCD